MCTLQCTKDNDEQASDALISLLPTDPMPILSMQKLANTCPIFSHWGIMYEKQPVSLMLFNELAY